MVEESGTSYNLVVLNAESNDAGRYTCHCLTMSSSALAEIILLGKKEFKRHHINLVYKEISKSQLNTYSESHIHKIIRREERRCPGLDNK